MKGTNNLPKNIFLAQFEIVLNFHYFCKVRACRISVTSLMRGTNNLSKNIFLIQWRKFNSSKNCLKLWRNTSLNEGNKQFIQKIFSSAQFEIVLNFHYFCKVRACRISVKNSIFQKLPKIVEKHFFDEGNKQFIQKIFLHTIWDSTKFSLFL